ARAIEAYMSPPGARLVAMPDAASPTDLVRRQELLSVRTGSTSKLAEQLKATREDLAVKRAEAERLHVAAQAATAEAESRLGRLKADQDQQAKFADSVETRLD